MKIIDINKLLRDPKMQNKNTNFKIIGERTKKPTILDVMVSLEEFKQEVRNGFAKQEKFNEKIMGRIDKLETRIDNLVVKNSLKE